jgi:carboxyl-terminal processing protease
VSRVRILIVFFLLQITANISLAAPLCSEALLNSIPDTAQKLELQYINEALKMHVTQKQLTPELTARAVKAFVSMLDPMGVLFTKEEYQYFSSLPAEDLVLIHSEMISPFSQKFFSKIAQVAYTRFEKIISELFNSKEYRENIINYHEDSDSSKSIEVNEKADEKLKKIISQGIDFIISQATDSQIKQITRKEAFMIFLRGLRLEISEQMAIYYPANLPIIISKAYVKSLDAHSDLLLPNEFHNYMKSLSDISTGLGVVVVPAFQGLMIIELSPEGAAAQSGLEIGDIITHISRQGLQLPSGFISLNMENWVITRNLPGDLFSKFTEGHPGTNFMIKVNRKGNMLERKITRTKIQAGFQKIETKIKATNAGNILHIKFERFYENSADFLSQAILQATSSKNISGMILDLRGNGGGSVDEMRKILGFFIKNGTAILSLTADHVTENLPIEQQNENLLWSGPLVVFLDSRSASASEALAGALQAYGRAIVIGDVQSFGKGSMQTLAASEGVGMKVTTALFFTPGGNSPQFDGIKSDVVVLNTNNKRFERDLEYAISPKKLPSVFLSKYPMMPNRDKLVGELKGRMIMRKNQSFVSNSKKLNDDEEAYRITEDLIYLLKEFPYTQ